MVKSEMVIATKNEITYPCLRCKYWSKGDPWIVYLYNVHSETGVPTGTVVWWKDTPEYVGTPSAFKIEETEPFNGSVTLS